MSDDIIYLEDFAPQIGQPVTDWTPIMAAALASFPHNLDYNGSSNGGTIIVGHRPGQGSLATLTNGFYNFLTPAIPQAVDPFAIEINRQVVIQGISNPGCNVYGRSQLQFVQGLGGVRCNYQHSPIQGMTDATGAKLERLALIGGRMIGPANVHGIFFSTTVTIDHCAILNFSGDGVRTVADSAVSPPSSSSLSLLLDVDASGNGGNGLTTQGGDANNLQIINFKARSNGGWGIYENSFLGSYYAGGQVASNNLGGIHASHMSAVNTFVGMYSENDQIHQIGPNNTIIGGVLAEAILAGKNVTPTTIQPSVISAGRMSAHVARSNDGKSEVAFGNGYNTPDMIFGMKDWSENNGAWPFRLRRMLSGGLGFDWGASGRPVLWFLNSRCTKANGFPFEISDVPDLRDYGGVAQRMHVLGTPGTGMICDDVGKSPPTDNRPLGSRRFNNSGTTGEPEYWLMTKGGWKPKGLI